MKRAGVAFAFFVFAGTASAAIFAPGSTSTSIGVKPVEITSSQEAATSPVVRSSASASIESRRPPVPYVPQAKPPAQLAALTEAQPPVVQAVAVPAPQAQAPQSKLDIATTTAKEVRNISDNQCGGRSIKSISVAGDGTVKVQC